MKKLSANKKLLKLSTSKNRETKIMTIVRNCLRKWMIPIVLDSSNNTANQT